METSLQKIIAAVVGVLMFFIIPVYISFEKVDDISYSLALKVTQNFVDNARDKGYISPDMYSDFVSRLYATGNSYDIIIEHTKKRYEPVINIKDSSGKLKYSLDYDKYITEYENNRKIRIDGVDYEYDKISISHTVNEEKITDKQILNKIFKGTGITKEEFLTDCLVGNADMYKSLSYLNENSYLMNEGDTITVTVKNRNQTIASTFYSLLTANVGLDDVAKVYVNYGGGVKNDGEGIIKYENGIVNSEVGRLFRYRGQAEEVTLDEGIYQIQCWGAAGGGEHGGKGAYVQGIFEITDLTTLYVYVGGAGSQWSETNKQNGGYNGGGLSYKGFGGGGATDVRLLKGNWDNTTSLLSRIIVAAGGGGSSNNDDANGAGGAGGNLSNGNNGKNAGIVSNYIGKGAKDDTLDVGYDKYEISEGTFVNVSPTEKGNLGVGGSVDFVGAGAGGAGYFGGSASHNESLGGGGGLSYIYQNETTYKDGRRYPFKSQILNEYSKAEYSEDEYPKKALEESLVFLDNGYFKGIKNNETETVEKNEVKKGNDARPKPLGILDVNVNGYAVIKKLK